MTRNALKNHEYRQALEVVAYHGGHFEGPPVRNFPGIDGWWEGIPASLKEITGSSPSAIARHARIAEEKARNAGYSGVELFINAKNVPAAVLRDFAPNGPLVQIPQQGTISAIHVQTSSGWIRIGSQGIDGGP